jgi:hypothetical protein
MSLLFFDGFDSYTVSDLPGLWTNGTFTNVFLPGGRQSIGQALRIDNNSTNVIDQCICHVPNSLSNTIIVGMAIFTSWSANPTGTTLFQIISRDFKTHAFVRLNSDSSLGIGTLLYPGGSYVETARSAANLIINGFWHFIELKVTYGASAAYELRLNQAPIISGTGRTISQGNTMPFGGILLRETPEMKLFRSGTTNHYDIWYDDFYLCDTNGVYHKDFLGDVRIQGALTARSNGTRADFSVFNAPSNYLAIQSNDNDTSYVTATTVGSEELYSLTTPQADPNLNVFGVQWAWKARKDNAGNRPIAPMVITPFGEYVGPAQNVGNSYAYYSYIYEVDPITGFPWTQTDVGNSEFGNKLV